MKAHKHVNVNVKSLSMQQTGKRARDSDNVRIPLLVEEIRAAENDNSEDTVEEKAQYIK